MNYDIDFDEPVAISNLIKAMIANTPIAYIVLDKNYRVHFINDFFLKLRKLRKEDVLGTFCYNLSNNGTPCQICAVRAAIMTGKSESVLRKDILPDGTVRFIDDIAVPIYKEDGKSFDYILEVMHNRTTEMLLREKARKVFYEGVKTLIQILEKKDAYTSTHSSDVSTISMKLAKYAKLSEEDVYRIGLSALMHDIGKIHIPDAIINKAGKLTDEEFGKIKEHPVRTSDMLGNLKSFEYIKELSLRHHERWDGNGYPGKIAGNAIPLGARIICIADTYDAMTSDRSYRKGLPHEVALEEIRKNAGKQFDPDLAEIFYELGTNIFTSRRSMIEKSEAALDEYMRKNKGKQVSRVITSSCKSAGGCGNNAGIPDLDMDNMVMDESFAAEIFKNAPAFYTVVSEAFDVLYVSDATARGLGMQKGDIIGKKCFEINNKNMSCFRQTGHGIACPTVRAFHTGTGQTGKVVEKFNGDDLYFDIYASPLDIVDRQGKKQRVVMEILFDRTKDVKVLLEMEEEINHLIDVLGTLIKGLDVESTKSADAIKDEYGTFTEYLSKVKEDVKAQFAEII